jgi:hypothetical protein
MQVEDFIASVGGHAMPKQGSEEWLAIREFSIGGSEINAILNKSDEALSSFVKSKLGLKAQFASNIYTRFGRIFERTIEQFVELYHDTTIYSTGSLPGPIPYQRYSPDGICVMTKTNLVKSVTSPVQEVLDHILEQYEEVLIILLEFKCPPSRIPTIGVPDHYMPQILTGLSTIPIVDLGLFVDASFRICEAADLTFNKNYTPIMQQIERDPDWENNPIAIGFIGIYLNEQKEQTEVNRAFVSLKDEQNRTIQRQRAKEMREDDDRLLFGSVYSCEDNNCASRDLVDFGDPTEFIQGDNYNVEAFTNRMGILFRRMTDTHEYGTWYSPIQATAANINSLLLKQIALFKHYSISHGKIPIGILPWKLMGVTYSIVERDPTWVDHIAPSVKKVTNVLSKCVNKSTNEKQKIVSTHFPDNIDDLKKSKLMSLLQRKFDT